MELKPQEPESLWKLESKLEKSKELIFNLVEKVKDILLALFFLSGRFSYQGKNTFTSKQIYLNYSSTLIR